MARIDGRGFCAWFQSMPAAWLLALAVWAAANPSPALGQVPRIQGQGTAASGMGNAFAAQADDPSALHYNPAGMTQLRGVQVMAGGLLSGGTTTFTSPTGVTAVGDRSGSLAWPPPGHLYVVANLKDLGVTALGDVTAGVGVTVPFGSLTRWPENGPFRLVTTFTTLPLLDIKPTVAYRLTPDLSVGLGADIYTFSGLIGEGHAETRFISPGAAPFGASGSKVEVNGKDTAAGFNVSLLYTALRNAAGLPVANIGLVYRSQATLHLDGALLSNGTKVSDVSTTLVLPQVITGGIAIWPVRNAEREWKLELDVDYVGWKSVRNLDVRLSNGAVIPQPQDWRSTYATLIGTEYRWLRLDSMPGWEVAARGGYTHQQTQMPDATFNPGVPSADVHILSIGLGFLCWGQGSLFGMPCGGLGLGPVKATAVGLDLSYQASLYEDRTVSGNGGVRAGVNGLYQTTLHTGGISVRINF
ncbi:OmpP1/FadL family transporter [Nitrospira moscoviensis]|nr:outer membrane protein transport protein [Nitrospira moscoviensis]